VVDNQRFSTTSGDFHCFFKKKPSLKTVFQLGIWKVSDEFPKFWGAVFSESILQASRASFQGVFVDNLEAASFPELDLRKPFPHKGHLNVC